MRAKASGPGEFESVDEFDGGVGWIAHPDETMQRTGHALVNGDEVWLVDPVDAEGLDDHLDRLGTMRGVVVLFNYHRRDAAAIARRHGVPVVLPEEMRALDDTDLDAAVERFDGRLGRTDYRLREVARSRLWQEWALFDGETLVVAESLGTAEYFRAPGERLGVSLVRRLTPPRSTLGKLAPDRILCGHGEGVFTDASGALSAALTNARRTAPHMYARNATTLVRNLAAAMR